MTDYHTSVLLQQTIDLLEVKPGKQYIDATLGGGGHSFEILVRGGEVLAIDVDQEALKYVEEKFKIQISKFKLKIVKGNFAELGRFAKENGFDKVAGIIFDLGVSGHQIDTPDRGFSFMQNGPLDMRMDHDLNVKAKDLINVLNRKELYELFYKLGEERNSYAISNAIVSARRMKPIETTLELTNIIASVVGGGPKKVDTYARIYQALRIAVNDELNSLEKALPQALELLDMNGRIAVISFHSLEDRIVKNQFHDWAKAQKGTIITKKPVNAEDMEINNNKRSRSAKLRVFQKN